MENPLQKGLLLEYVTLGWNVIGCVIVIALAVKASSLSLFGFGIDSVIEIFASVVVIWQLRAINKIYEGLATKLIGVAFILLSLYIVTQVTFGLAHHSHASPSVDGIIWLTVTAIVMFLLAYGKKKVGQKIDNPVLIAESRVTVIDGLLAVSVLIGLLATTYLGWWWTDSAASLVIVFYGIKEALHAFS